ncbi:MAG TPA: phosphoenolpyruvate carboxykinase (ATP) [Bryobacteraceae bacterium]|nr:phosphoenolpyruvate carboxykinase (ATP) [Bryobacteraceae bacterium]
MSTEKEHVAGPEPRTSHLGLEEQGIRNARIAYWNLGSAQLVEHAVRRGEGSLSAGGALVVETGQFTGRSPKDKFVVRDERTESAVQWGATNQPMTDAAFESLHAKIRAYLQGREIFVQDCQVGADPDYALPTRVVCEYAWHSLFARQLFICPGTETLSNRRPAFTILFVPEFQANPKEDGTRSETCIALHFTKRIALICGTRYAGEMKKSAFTVMNYLLPESGVLPMHCSANVGAAGDTALFFGLSGTGKTTLSADPARRLIGDDEHGWSSRGIFNFEGGSYAKCIRLSREHEPQIWNAIRFGTVLENVVMDPESRELDFDSAAITENTRAAYPLAFMENAVHPSMGGHPRNVILLTADAFGVLPPIARLTHDQAVYHFLSGYTAKVAGTERGLSAEPQATFSACFGAPFLPRPASEYAALLGEKLRRHKVTCWLLNTGWVGGPYGIGERMSLPYTRAMLHAALSGELQDAPATPHPVFQVAVPQSCPGVPDRFLDARGMWADGLAYDCAAQELNGRFLRNFQSLSSGEMVETSPAG